MAEGDHDAAAGESAPRPPSPHARTAALEALIDADRTGRYVDSFLAERGKDLAERDRRLLQEIACGAIRHRNTLDHLLDPFLRVPLSRQRPAIAWALRLGAFQIVYLSRVPPHAAVDSTLEALKSAGAARKKDVGFVNAVLRRLLATVDAHSGEAPAAGDVHVLPVRDGFCRFRVPVLPAADHARGIPRLSLEHSLPAWLVERWLERFGAEEAALLCAAQNRTPAVTARLTAQAPPRDEVIALLAAEGIEASPGTLAASLRLKPKGPLERSAVMARGWLQVQDETAMRIGAVLAPPAGAHVLDLCAAPGGKAVQLLERVGARGRFVAAERSTEKLRLLEENLARTCLPFAVRAVGRDPDAIDLGEEFTHALVDAPCSNTGVLARRPEARWRLRPGDLTALAEKQGRLLAAAWRHLRPGGRLVYATCSIEAEENEDVAAAFCLRHPEATELETALYLPHRAGADGGFFSLLLRRADPRAREAPSSS